MLTSRQACRSGSAWSALATSTLICRNTYRRPERACTPYDVETGAKASRQLAGLIDIGRSFEARHVRGATS